MESRSPTAETPPLGRGPVGPRAPAQRSAVTNGRRLFVEGDGNSAWSRRYRDLVAGHVSDLGGAPVLSEAQLSLCRRASALECELEQMEGRLSMGEEIDLDVFARAASHLRRLFETLHGLGIERKPRTIATLGDLLAQDIQRQQQEALP